LQTTKTKKSLIRGDSDKWQDTQIQFVNYAEEKNKNSFLRGKNAIQKNVLLNPGIMHPVNMVLAEGKKYLSMESSLEKNKKLKDSMDYWKPNSEIILKKQISKKALPEKTLLKC
jgi:hypothetical protein